MWYGFVAIFVGRIVTSEPDIDLKWKQPRIIFNSNSNAFSARRLMYIVTNKGFILKLSAQWA